MVLSFSVRTLLQLPAAPYIAALILGALNGLAFAPFDAFVLGWVAIGGLYWLLHTTECMRRAFLLGWAYSFTLQLVTLYWIEHSIQLYGQLPYLLAIVLATASWLLLSSYGALAVLVCVLLRRFVSTVGVGKQGVVWCMPLVFACVMTLQEWTQTLHPLAVPAALQGYTGWFVFAGLYPLIGTLGVSFITWLLPACLLHMFMHSALPVYRLLGVALLSGAVTLLAFSTHQLNWTQEQAAPVKVTLLQPNRSLLQHWQPDYARQSFALLKQHSVKHAQSEVIIWPENAMGLLLNEVEYDLHQFVRLLQSPTPTSLIVGLIREDKQQNTRTNRLYYNSLIALTESVDKRPEIMKYDKQNMVPFGEYMPFSSLFAPVLNWLGVPYSLLTYNPKPPRTSFSLADTKFIPLICYDVDYGQFVRAQVEKTHEPSVIIAASDESWFGESTAQAARLRIHQIRARETGKWVLRATGSGITAAINPRGEVVASIPAFISAFLTVDVYPAFGMTPYVRFGWAGLLLLVFISVVLVRCVAQVSKREVK